MNPLAVSTDAQIETVAQIARVIWPEHYVPIIGQAQVDFMLVNFQGASAIRSQIDEGYRYFLMDVEGKLGGYFSFRSEPQEQRMFLSKLYLLKAMRGQGLATQALRYVESQCPPLGLSRVRLTVHRFNPSVEIYKHLGFEILGPIVTDIGHGFFMDDYQMEKRL